MGETSRSGPGAPAANRPAPSSDAVAAANGDATDFGIDVAAERARTAGCQIRHHLNAAGSALAPREVVEATIDHLRLEELEGGYEAAKMRTEQLEAVYRAAADLLGAGADEIALVDSASTGLRVIIDAMRLGGDDTVIMSRSAYVSHALHLLTLANETGMGLEIIDCAPSGEIDLDQLDEVLSRVPNPVVCPAHIPTSSGLVEPAVEIGKLAAAHGARYILDATQSVGQLPMNVDDIGCDALVTTGRKFLRGPRGTAVLYARRQFLENLAPLAPDVRGALWTGDRTWTLDESARRFEVFENSIAGRLGLGVALHQALDRGMHRTAAYIGWLADTARARLRAVDGVEIADPPAARSGIVTFVLDGVAAADVVTQLAAADVRVVSVPASHAQWDLGHRGHPAVVRASVHVYNTSADVDALVAAVERIAAGTAPSKD